MALGEENIIHATEQKELLALRTESSGYAQLPSANPGLRLGIHTDLFD